MFCACGGSALKPANSAGVTTMKMISSTSMTSTIGVTFGVDLSACASSTRRHCHGRSLGEVDYCEIGPPRRRRR